MKLAIQIFTTVALFTLTLAAPLLAEPPSKPRIGFTTSLTGDGAISGIEMKNAALLANEVLADNAFEVFFEDERCMGAPAATAARKLVDIEKVKYAMGFFCNVSLLTAAPIYVKARVPLISSCATTMDTPDVGPNIFRLFPADQLSIPVLYNYVQPRYKNVGLLVEEDAYAQMLGKEFKRLNSASSAPFVLAAEDYPFEATDLRPSLLKMKAKKIDAIFISSATEPTFIRIVRQMNELGIKVPIVGVYTPVSEVALKELGKLLEGAVAATLSDLGERANGQQSKELMIKYRTRFGAPQSAFPVVLTTFEAMRLTTIAERNNRPIGEVVRDPAVLEGSLIGPYSFDKHGAVQGIQFELQQIQNGKVVPIH